MDCRKVIKVLGILSIIGALVCFGAGVLTIVGGGILSAAGANNELMSQIEADPQVSQSMENLNAQLSEEGMDPINAQKTTMGLGFAGIILGVSLIIKGILNIFEAVFAFKAANGKGAKPAFIWGIIALVFTVLAALSSGLQGITTYALSILLDALYVYCAKTIKDEEATA